MKIKLQDIKITEASKEIKKFEEKAGLETHILNELQRESLRAELQLKEQREIIEMRGQWSWWVLACIVSINIFDFLVIGALGFHWISFEGYVIPVFIADSLLKTLGLAAIIVNFLFNERSIRK